jgi:transposase
MPPGAGEPDRPRARAAPGRELAALREIRESARAWLAAGQVEATWEFFLSALDAVLLKNRDLERLVAQLRRARIGMKSERMDPAQLALLLATWLAHREPAEVDPAAEAQADAALERAIEGAEQAPPRAERTRRPPGPGWPTRGVPRALHRVEVPEAERTCRGCGRAMTVIGEDISRRLECVPAHFVEHEYHRAKYACGTWLSRIDARSGVEIPVSTLADWTAGVGDLVAPLVERLAQRGLAAAIVRTDATGLKVLDPQSPEPIQRGSIWALYSVRTPGE